MLVNMLGMFGGKMRPLMWFNSRTCGKQEQMLWRTAAKWHLSTCSDPREMKRSKTAWLNLNCSIRLTRQPTLRERLLVSGSWEDYQKQRSHHQKKLLTKYAATKGSKLPTTEIDELLRNYMDVGDFVFVSMHSLFIIWWTLRTDRIDL